MRHICDRSQTPIGASRPARGFTLVELVASVAIMSIVLAGASAALLIASRSVDDGTDPRAQVTRGALGIDQLVEELTYAVAITARTGEMIEFTVDDRDGDDNDETILYSWSGTAGHPLRRSYNGGDAVVVVDDVQDFSLAYHTVEGQPIDEPKVVMVVANSGSLTSGEYGCAQVLLDLGFRVAVISDSAAQESFDGAVPNTDVFFVRRSIDDTQLDEKLVGSVVGVVNEHEDMVEIFEFSANGYGANATTIEVEDNSHPVTANLSEGNVALALLSKSMIVLLGTVAPGARILAEYPNTSYPMVAVMEPGDQMLHGGRAAGRRVIIPTSPNSTSFLSDYTNASKILLRDALKWAAQPLLITSVDVALQTGTASSLRVETSVETLNRPNAKGA